MDISKETTIEFKVNENQKEYLKKIIKELSQSNSIDSESMEEFLKLTVFIVLDEYEKNKESLKDFYKKNKEAYNNNKNKIFT
jgi:peptide methionine sulfoxide reductase MsrA